MSNSANTGNVWVLLSGGVDSTACVAFYLEHDFSVSGMFVDYGQGSAQREIKAAESIARHYDIPLSKLVWSGLREKKSGFICGRNAFLLIGTLMELPQDAGILSLGIHSGTVYLDCAQSFVSKMQSVFDIYTQGRIQIGTPFLKWTKGDIWTYSKSQGVPLELTYSCELGTDQPCGLCLSCRDLENLYARA